MRDILTRDRISKRFGLGIVVKAFLTRLGKGRCRVEEITSQIVQSSVLYRFRSQQGNVQPFQLGKYHR